MMYGRMMERFGKDDGGMSKDGGGMREGLAKIRKAWGRCVEG